MNNPDRLLGGLSATAEGSVSRRDAEEIRGWFIESSSAKRRLPAGDRIIVAGLFVKSVEALASLFA